MDKTWRSRVFGQGRTRSGGPRLCADRSGAKNSTPLWSIFDAKSELFEFGFCALSILLINNSDVLLLISISVQIFEVDDLICNTLGGMLGFVMTPVFVFMLPKRERMDEIAYKRGQVVSEFRRAVAWIIDIVVIIFAGE